MYDEELIDFLKQLNPELNDIDIKLNYTKVLCGLKLPGKNNHIEISKPVSKLDIKPTLCYLSGIEDGLYEKSEEVHCQKAYPQEEIETLIKEAGMELLAVYDAYTLNPATEDSERLFFVAREKGKKKQ